MDPISMIVGALAAGSVAGLTDTATTAIKDAYAGLRAVVVRLFAGRPAAETALAEYERDPDGAWKAPLAAELERAGAGSDEAVIAATRRLIEAIEQQPGTRASKYVVDARGAQVGQVGNHNTGTFTFGAPPNPPA